MPYTQPFNPNPNRPDGEAVVIIYNYVPSLVLGILAAIGFAAIGVAHVFWFARSRGLRWFEGLIVFGCCMETLGYIFRILSHGRPYFVGYFVAQYFLIVCAPVAFSAALYLSLSNAISTNPVHSTLIPIRPKVFVATFITIDVLTTILQVAGSALIGVAESKFYNGEKSPLTPAQANDILLAGLALQIASFTFFLGLLLRIIFQTRAQPNTFTKRFLTLLFLTSMMIYTRTIFRLGETAEGVFGFASSHEALFGVFEFAPVIIAVLCWAIWPLVKEIEGMQGNGEMQQETEQKV